MGNRELLAVKVALGEWRHWLEGAELTFLVWTDHKNLGRGIPVKPGGPFSLIVSLLRCLTVQDPRMLSLMPCLACLTSSKFVDTILPSSCVVRAVSLAVEERVKWANVTLTVPVGCPLNRLSPPS